MEKIKITADSSCSLPQELLEKYQISLVYLEINIGGYLFQDGTEVTGENLFEYHDRTGNFAEALPVPKETLRACFAVLAKEYDCIIHVGSSVGSTRSYKNAVDMEKEFPNVSVVDAGHLSAGMGLLVICAAELAAKGASAKEILAKLDRYRRKVHASFLIGTMEYFYQSERCSGFTRYITELFRMRPSVVVIDGKMITGKMYHGEPDMVRAAYISDFIKDIRHMNPRILILAYSGCTAVFTEYFYKKIASCGYFEHILMVKDSAAISSHCGPDTFGIYCFYKEEQKRRGGHESFSVGRGR